MAMGSFEPGFELDLEYLARRKVCEFCSEFFRVRIQ